MTEGCAAKRPACWMTRRMLAGLVAVVLAGCGGERGAAVASDTALPPGESAGVASSPMATVPAVPPPDSASPPLPAVSAFIRFVETERTPDSAGVAQGYAAEGVRLLASGIEALAARDTASAASVSPRLTVLRARADSMQREAEPLTRARLASEAFVLAGDLLQTLQEGLAQPALTDRAAEARQAAAAIRSDQPLATQADAVRRFFERSAAAVRGLTGARAS
ncbi:MAG: hypothetical protein ACXWZS_03515 [Gemmatirosa sp.]